VHNAFNPDTYNSADYGARDDKINRQERTVGSEEEGYSLSRLQPPTFTVSTSSASGGPISDPYPLRLDTYVDVAETGSQSDMDRMEEGIKRK
jgi:hypothetical protein